MKRAIPRIVLALALVFTLIPAMGVTSFADDTAQLPAGLSITDAQGQDVPYGEGWAYNQEQEIEITESDLYISGAFGGAVWIDGNVANVNVGDFEGRAIIAREGSTPLELKLASSTVSVEGLGADNRDIKITGEAPVLNFSQGAECDSNVEIAVEDQLTIFGTIGVTKDLTVTSGVFVCQDPVGGVPSPLIIIGGINAAGYKVSVAAEEGDWTAPSKTFGIFRAGMKEYRYYTIGGTVPAASVKFEEDDSLVVQRMNSEGKLETVESGPDTWEFDGLSMYGTFSALIIHENNLYLKGDLSTVEVRTDNDVTSVNLNGFKCEEFNVPDYEAVSTFTFHVLTAKNEIGNIDSDVNADIRMTGNGTLTVTKAVFANRSFEIAGDSDFALNYIGSDASRFFVGEDLKITSGTLDAAIIGENAWEPVTPIIMKKACSLDGCDILMAADEGAMTASSGKTECLEVDDQKLYYFVLDNGDTARHIRFSKGGDISTGEISGVNNVYAYTGEAITPAVTAKTATGTVLTEDTDYTVTYTNNTNVGTATVTVTGTGVYSGTIEKTFEIRKPGWQKIDGKWYYYNADGTMATSTWKKDSKGWCWLGADGAMLTSGWAKDSKGWCWIGTDGYMVEQTKWIKIDGDWYHITKGYRDQSKWMQDSKGWCWLQANGAMLTNGWAKDSKGWCWMGADGYWVSSKWVKDAGEWYYIKANHYMACNEWAKDSGGWMWMNASGRITKSKWIQDGGYWYYLKSNGYMATGTQTIDGRAFKFDSSGRCLQ